MSINPNNANSLLELFNGLYEPGSDGVAINIESTKPAIDTTTPVDQFTGYITETNNKVYLSTLGGGRFELDLQSTINPSDFKNKVISVSGRQVSDTIVNAVIINSGTQKPAKGKLKVDEAMVTLADVVKRFLNIYNDRVNNLLTARPGYKYENGMITKIPAIVAVVDRKINLASVTENNRLPDSFENYDVEVVAASPKNLLRYKFDKEVSPTGQLPEKLAPTLLES
jgi:hypothetical protein